MGDFDHFPSDEFYIEKAKEEIKQEIIKKLETYSYSELCEIQKIIEVK